MTDAAALELEPTHPISVLWQWGEERPFSDETLGSIVRAVCSEVYSELRSERPGTSKEVLNADPRLVALNSVRKTLHQTMVRRHKQASKSRKQASWKV